MFPRVGTGMISQRNLQGRKNGCLTMNREYRHRITGHRVDVPPVCAGGILADVRRPLNSRSAYCIADAFCLLGNGPRQNPLRTVSHLLVAGLVEGHKGSREWL